MDDVGARLDKAAKLGGFKSRRKMAKALGISYNTMNNWITRGKITEKGAVQIASKIPIPLTYLLTGESSAEPCKPKVIQHFNDSPVGGLRSKGDAVLDLPVAECVNSISDSDIIDLKDDEKIILNKFRELDEEQREDVFLKILDIIRSVKRKEKSGMDPEKIRDRQKRVQLPPQRLGIPALGRGLGDFAHISFREFRFVANSIIANRPSSFFSNMARTGSASSISSLRTAFCLLLISLPYYNTQD